MDVSARYRINKRFSTTASLPIVFNRFSTIQPPLGIARGNRFGWRGRGIGDLTLYTEGLLLEPSSHPFGNIGLGLGVKLPTGEWNQKAVLPNETGTGFSRRAVWPAAIMPGDGGVGVIAGFNAFKVIRKVGFMRGNTIFASGSYLFNPRNTNATQSVVSTLGVPLTPNFLNQLTNSVTDSYNLQGGVALRVPKTWDNEYLKDLRVRFIAGWQGIPFRDLIGQSDGYRQPGYTVTMGPSATYSLGRNFWIVDVPFVVLGHVDAGRSMIPGLPVKGPDGSLRPAVLTPNRNLGLIPPVSIAVRYVRSF